VTILELRDGAARLRPAEESDAPFVASAWMESQRGAPPWREVPAHRYYPSMTQRIARLFRQSAVLVACDVESPSVLMGCLVHEGAALIHMVYVKSAFRGFGLARKLVRAVEERAAALGHRVLNLDVRETQTTAIALFEALGYVHWGTHPFYARVNGQTVGGRYYFKPLEPGRGRSTGALLDPTQ
jgi:ribosomal protein S18 acetylase RimI-like enzyme